MKSASNRIKIVLLDVSKGLHVRVNNLGHYDMLINNQLRALYYGFILPCPTHCLISLHRT
ncbi:MAG: hypothetical protein ACJAUQ_001615 [Maribacter sp.]|jgi:hypothetical protein